MLEGGGGFRDFSRIAAYTTPTWVEDCLENKQVVLTELAGFKNSVSAIKQAIQDDQQETLYALLNNVSAARKAWPIAE